MSLFFFRLISESSEKVSIWKYFLGLPEYVSLSADGATNKQQEVDTETEEETHKPPCIMQYSSQLEILTVDDISSKSVSQNFK